MEPTEKELMSKAGADFSAAGTMSADLQRVIEDLRAFRASVIKLFGLKSAAPRSVDLDTAIQDIEEIGVRVRASNQVRRDRLKQVQKVLSL